MVGEGAAGAAAAAAAAAGVVLGGGGVRHVGGELSLATAAADAGETGLETATGQMRIEDGDGVDREGVAGGGGGGGGDGDDGDSPRDGQWQVSFLFGIYIYIDRVASRLANWSLCGGVGVLAWRWCGRHCVVVMWTCVRKNATTVRRWFWACQNLFWPCYYDFDAECYSLRDILVRTCASSRVCVRIYAINSCHFGSLFTADNYDDVGDF